MFKKTIGCLLVLVVSFSAFARQTPRVRPPSGPTFPASCTAGPPQADLFVKTGSGTTPFGSTPGLYVCDTSGTPGHWSFVANAATAGVASINGDTNSHQVITTDSTGSDIGITTASGTSTIHVPDASGSARGVVTTGSQTFTGAKQFSSLSATGNLSSQFNIAGDPSGSTGTFETVVSNDGSTGTTNNKIAKLTGAPAKAVTVSTSDTGGAIGIVATQGGTTGAALIATGGIVGCVFDAATTAGDYVQISSSVTGDCRDAGAVYPSTGQVLGRVLTTNGSAGTYGVLIFASELRGSSEGGGGTNFGYYNPLDFGAAGNGTSDDTAAFNTMLAAIGSNLATVTISRTGNQFLLSNLTFPWNVTLNFEPSGGIKVVSGQVVTILGPILAAPQQIFFNSHSTVGQGEISFGATSHTNSTLSASTPHPQRSYWAEWFGVIADNQNSSAVNNADGFDAAFLALPNGCDLNFGGTFYRISHGLTFQYKFQSSFIGNRTDIGVTDFSNKLRPTFVYLGAAGGVAFTVKNCIACTFKGFNVFGSSGTPSDGGPSDTNILITQDNPAVGVPNIVSHNAFEQMSIWALTNDSNWIGIDMSNAGGNNEQHLFKEIEFLGNSGVGLPHGNQIGVRQNQNQVKAIIYDRCSFAGLGTGIDGQGNFRAYNNIWEGVDTMYADHDLIESSFVIGDDAENMTYVWKGFNGSPGSKVTFINDRWQNIAATGVDAAHAPMQFVGGNYTLQSCDTSHISTYGPYFFGNVSTGGFYAAVHDTTWFATTLQFLSPGWATGNTIVTQGPNSYTFGPLNAAATSTQVILQGATPGFASTRPILSMPGATAVPVADPIVFGSGSLAIGGLQQPSPLSASAVGSIGTPTTRFFSVIAVDAAGRRSLRAVQPNGDAFISTGWNSTLSGTNYITLSWLSQNPSPDHYEVWDVNTSNTIQWRFVANVTPLGTGTEFYNIQANPTGSYISTVPTRNEAETILLRNLALSPTEVTFTDGAGSPSVAVSNDWVTSNSGPTTYTNFTNPTLGQIIRIRVADTNSQIQNNSNIVTGTGANIVCLNGVIYSFVYRGTAWHFIGSSVSLTTQVTGILPPANGGTGVANNSASTITISGNFPLTTTLTGSTNVTLPTSGTLSALNGTNTWSGANAFSLTIVGNRATYTGVVGTTTLNLANGNIQQFTFGAGNETIALSNIKDGTNYTIVVIQDSGGSRTITWPASIKWVGASAPTLSTGAAARDQFVFTSDGTNLYEVSRALNVH